MTETITMTRAELAEVMRRHRGAIRDVANKINRSHVSVSRWLSGDFDSELINRAVQKHVKKLQQEEQK